MVTRYGTEIIHEILWSMHDVKGIFVINHHHHHHISRRRLARYSVNDGEINAWIKSRVLKQCVKVRCREGLHLARWMPKMRVQVGHLVLETIVLYRIYVDQTIEKIPCSVIVFKTHRKVATWELKNYKKLSFTPLLKDFFYYWHFRNPSPTSGFIPATISKLNNSTSVSLYPSNFVRQISFSAPHFHY